MPACDAGLPVCVQEADSYAPAMEFKLPVAHQLTRELDSDLGWFPSN